MRILTKSGQGKQYPTTLLQRWILEKAPTNLAVGEACCLKVITPGISKRYIIVHKVSASGLSLLYLNEKFQKIGHDPAVAGDSFYDCLVRVEDFMIPVEVTYEIDL